MPSFKHLAIFALVAAAVVYASTRTVAVGNVIGKR